MGWEAMHDAIRSRFKAQVEDVITIAVQYDNAPLDPPATSAYIRFTIRPRGTRLIEIGNAPTRRTEGDAVAEVFVPLEEGDEEAQQIADTVADAFRCVRADGVVYLTPSVTLRGRDVVGKWWQLSVSCPFWYDET